MILLKKKKKKVIAYCSSSIQGEKRSFYSQFWNSVCKFLSSAVFQAQNCNQSWHLVTLAGLIAHEMHLYRCVLKWISLSGGSLLGDYFLFLLCTSLASMRKLRSYLQHVIDHVAVLQVSQAGLFWSTQFSPRPHHLRISTSAGGLGAARSVLSRSGSLHHTL